MRAWFLQKPEEGVGSPGTRVPDDCESLLKVPVLLATEPSLQPPSVDFQFNFKSQTYRKITTGKVLYLTKSFVFKFSTCFGHGW